MYNILSFSLTTWQLALRLLSIIYLMSLLNSLIYVYSDRFIKVFDLRIPMSPPALPGVKRTVRLDWIKTSLFLQLPFVFQDRGAHLRQTFQHGRRLTLYGLRQIADSFLRTRALIRLRVTQTSILSQKPKTTKLFILVQQHHRVIKINILLQYSVSASLET